MKTLACLIAMAVNCPSSAHCQDAAAAFLRHVSAEYRSLNSYVISAKVTRSAGSSPIPDDHIADLPDPAGEGWINSMFSTDFVRANGTYWVKIERSGKKVRYEWRDRLGEAAQGILFTDGNTTWKYSARTNKYMEYASTWPPFPGPYQGLPGLEWKFVTRFMAVQDMAEKATLKDDDVSPDSICSAPTAKVEIQLAKHGHPALETLRVYTRTGLICQSIDWQARMSGVHVQEFRNTTTWDYLTVASAPLKDFEFVPPKGARRVTKLD